MCERFRFGLESELVNRVQKFVFAPLFLNIIPLFLSGRSRDGLRASPAHGRNGPRPHPKNSFAGVVPEEVAISGKVELTKAGTKDGECPI